MSTCEADHKIIDSNVKIKPLSVFVYKSNKWTEMHNWTNALVT